MKSLKLLVAASLLAFGAALIQAADKPAEAKSDTAKCCAKAAKDGKTCAHECCVAAAKDGKNCEKCGGKNAPAPAPKS
jgi:hypothetical protein